MLFKVVGQNQWVIWNCFGSTKNCHPCCLVVGMPYLKIVFFFSEFVTNNFFKHKLLQLLTSLISEGVQVFSTAARWAVLCGPIGVVEASRGPIPPSIQNCQGGLPNTSCLIQIWAGLLRGRQCGHPQEGQIEPGEGGGSRGCQVQPKVAEGHGLYEKVICLDCLIWLHRR